MSLADSPVWKWESAGSRRFPLSEKAFTVLDTHCFKKIKAGTSKTEKTSVGNGSFWVEARLGKEALSLL